ncbi:hypothetical protein DL764_005077 [Monosporascus ibericus]|uniref:chitinase n=1 Tax=Monosporascus ibericus TaxID=155417 RepID=A0A4Q4TC75_9PEZI|nr:hypothetical protein DL764_005077 [Monosporascus ibericus]
MIFSRRSVAAAAAAVLLSSPAAAQTWTACNPLTNTCPANTALGMAIDVDFTQGAVNSFEASGGTVTYDSNGAAFTVNRGGDAPQLTSVFYIMFGRVEFTLKAAPGAGIVSSFVLQSDCLDEIDWEWLGADPNEVQTNYFGKGITGSYNRGQFHQLSGTQSDYITYTLDWTSERIVWTAGGTVLREMGYNDAEEGQYPQTPMQVKFGAWSGGDPSNSPGTIDWSRGPTDYSQGPFTMYVKSVKVTDYSTGSSYTYGDSSGTWQSIQAEGGEVNGNEGNAGILTTTAVAAGTTSTSEANVPVGGIGGSGETGSGSYDLPEGWVMTSEGKIVPVGSSSATPTSPLSSPSPSARLSQAPGGSGVETITTFDGKGLLTTMTVPAGFSTMPKSYDDQGFQVFPTAVPAPGSGDAEGFGSEDPTDSIDVLSTEGEGEAAALLPAPRLLNSVGVGLVIAVLYVI